MKFLFVGDVMLGRLVNEALKQEPPEYPWGDTLGIFRGIEIYKKHPIIYCAGNFIDDYAIDPVERNDQSFIFALKIEIGSIILYPTIIENFQAKLAQGEEAKQITDKMKRLCARMGTFAKWNSGKNQLEIKIS